MLASAAACAETAAPAPTPTRGFDAQRLQQQNLNATLNGGELANELVDTVPPAQTRDLARLPAEQPCFPIREIVLRDNPFRNLEQIVKPAEGQCIGTQGLKIVQDAVATELIERGYVTTRVTVPAQSLSSERLMLQIAPGLIGDTRSSDDAIGALATVLPFASGSVLNQHAIDQALETIRRLPSQADARFDIAPGELPGESDVILYPGSGKRWHASIGYDNAGPVSTGKNEVSASLTIDSPLGLYDQVQLYGLSNADRGAPGKGTDVAATSYSVPFGYGMFAFDASQSNTLQSVASTYGPIQYANIQKYASVRLSAVVHRNARSRTELRTRFYRATNDVRLNAAPQEINARDVYGFELGASHRRYIGRTQLDASVGYTGTLPGISKMTGYVVDHPGRAGRQQLETASVNALTPFRIGGQTFSWQTNWRTQNALTPVAAPDYFTIGTRFAVRGFDQRTTLAAESGWTLSNELDWYAPTPLGTQALYAGVDAGRVRGPTAKYLVGNTLVGMVFGVKGSLAKKSFSSSSVAYDVSVGWPLHKPAGFSDRSPTMLMQVSVLI
ncbi:polypeptide-transport-associated domain-containing protein [Caballeronia glebae]|uniref:Polypeptide-transport-associated domain-containing protein n=1 Tax=Caballeronia glebae TaxID=1777143 RepID=A0A157ZL75_9BURK|nr:ShlB/FhaC/HecB family hemolysin secretion/activation protein [Caballeronia glebae]SAK46253.1 polypeptide-transport-associated domain-containing protein [Caballeronia glebae]